QVYSFTPADSGAYSFSWTQAGGSLKVYDSFGGSLTASSEPFTVPLVGGQTYYVSAGFAEGSGAFSVSLTDGGAALYNIFPPTGYGTVSCAASAPAGSRVYLKPVPDTGYAYVEGTLRVYFIFDEETLYEAEDGWFWFTMPDHDVYVQAQFEPHYVELSFAGDERANPISIAYENTQTSIEGTSVQVLAGLQTVVTVAIPYDCELSAVLTTAGGETVSCSCRWDSYNEWSVTFTAPEEDATITFTLTPLTLRALALDEPLAVSGDREIFTFTPEADGFYRFVSSNLDAALFVAADDGHNLVGEPYPYGTTPSLKLTAGHTYYVIYEGDDDGETYTVTAFSPADYTVTFHADPEILLWENSVEADGNLCSGETFTVSSGGSVAVYFELPAFFGWEPTVSFETASGEAIVYELTISDCHMLVFRMPAENVTVTLSAVPVTYPALALGENALTESDETYSFTAETAGYYSFVSAGHNIMIFDASNWCFDGSDDEAGCVLAAGQQVYVTVGTDLVDPDPSIVPDETITVTLESALESYAITIADGMTGGTVTTDVSSAPEGGSVFVTVTPEEGMELGALVVRGANTGRQIPMSSNSLYEDCHFTMPDEPVTIRAIFAEKPIKIRYEYENANGPYYVTVDCASGERPSAPDMYWYVGDDGCYYLFEGWSDGENVYASYALPPATADATYTAVFSQYNNETAHAITVESEPGTFVTFLNIDGNYFPVNNPWEGVTVALYATASGIDDGWYIAGFTVTDADGNKLPLFIDQWGYPCFRMPASDVTVTFTYTQDVQTFRIEKDPEAVSFNGAMVNGVWRYSVDEDGFPAAPGSEVWIWLQSDRTLEVSVVPEGGSPIRSRCEEEASFPGYWGVYFTMPNAPVTVTVTAGEPNLNKAGLSLGINTLRGDSYSNNTYFFSPEEDGLYSFSWVGDRPDSGDIRDAADTAGSAEDYWSESGSFYLSGGRTYILTVDFSGSKRYFLDIEREETPQTHTISLANAANGTAELSHAAAPEGTAVLVQMNVAPGYDESYPKITYYDGESWQNEYCEATATKGLFYFIMPAADVTVTPVFYPWYHEVRLLFDGTAVHPVISLNGESQEGSFTAYTGDTIELEIEPYNGYYVDGVTVNGEELLPEGGVYSLTITDESECIFEIQIFHVDHKHTWGEWETLTAATCTEAAVETRSCTVDGCGAAQTRTVGEPLGHDYVAVVTKEPTATEEGIMTYTCSRCGVSYMLYIPKLQVVYPTYLDGADGNVKANYVAWAAKYGPDTGSAHETAFLLNISPATSIPAGAALLKVVRFDLTAAGCRLELASDMCGLFQPEGRSGTSSLCNGVLVVELADDLGAFATSISLPVTIDASGHAVIDFDFGDVALPSALFLMPAIAVKGIVKD
ncbi:MAG: hypothetical protein J6U40_08845, partial [Kiritimatiellae bacterium]|nr:hypothetical protein [Kiritimatiellia bacterium]